MSGISSNSKKQFTVADNKDCIVKVFDSNGKFLHSLFCPGADGSTSVCGICDITTHQNDNVYVLVTLEKKATELVRGVCMFAKDNSLCHWFALRAGFRGYVLTVEESSSRLCVLGSYCSPEWESELFEHNHRCVVVVYETNGGFVCSFAVHGTVFSVVDITTGSDGRVMLLTTDCIQVLNVQGVLHCKWSKVAEKNHLTHTLYSQKFHSVNEHVFIVSNILECTFSPELKRHCFVSIYTEDGVFICTIHLNSPQTKGTTIEMTVTMAGRIAIAYSHYHQGRQGEIHVL